jgi:FixJ family two-component response regulator
MRSVTTPIVLMSAFADEAMRVEAEALGATALLKKPIDGTALLGAVRDAVTAKHPPTNT